MQKRAGVHQKGKFGLSDMLKTAKQKPGFSKVGAVALFVGVVRGENYEGESVQELELEAYEEKADESLQGICEEMRERKGIVDVQIHHLLGRFNVGDELVYVLVAGSGRTHVFPVLREAIERYKTEAPIFKKEVVIDKDGMRKSRWVTEKPDG